MDPPTNQKSEYNIGLDFGTSQSKVCVLHVSEHPQKHEFIQFLDNDEELSYFFPSIVFLNQNDTLSFGYQNTNHIKKVFRYFKIASADDETFRIQSDFEADKETYKSSDFEPFTPEVLSVLYLAYILLFVKEKFGKKEEPAGLGGFLKRFIATKEETVDFTVQLGIPTEFSKTANTLRRKKFETILILAESVVKKYNTREELQKSPYSDLLKFIAEKNKVYQKDYNHEESFKELMNKFHVSIFPETAAGLTFLVKTKQLSPGYYSALDIGAGSTDLSFFRVTEENQFLYLASESLLLASNFFYQLYFDVEYLKPEGLEKIASEVKSKIEASEWEQDDQYFTAIEKFLNELHKIIYKIFNSRVYPHFKKYVATKNYDEQPCFVYGGGSLLPYPDKYQDILIHDSGNRDGLNINRVHLNKSVLGDYIPKENTIPEDQSWSKLFNFLTVAYGLSYKHYFGESDWDDQFYTSGPPPGTDSRIPHPINQDCYIYNVFSRDWGY